MAGRAAPTGARSKRISSWAAGLSDAFDLYRVAVRGWIGCSRCRAATSSGRAPMTNMRTRERGSAPRQHRPGARTARGQETNSYALHVKHLLQAGETMKDVREQLLIDAWPCHQLMKGS